MSVSAKGPTKEELLETAVVALLDQQSTQVHGRAGERFGNMRDELKAAIAEFDATIGKPPAVAPAAEPVAPASTGHASKQPDPTTGHAAKQPDPSTGSPAKPPAGSGTAKT
jgi:hypothetical protein